MACRRVGEDSFYPYFKQSYDIQADRVSLAFES